MNIENLRLICGLAIALSATQVRFIGQRVGSIDERWSGTQAELIAHKERLYADFKLLRSAQLTRMGEEEWKAYLDRRWEQFAKCDFTFRPKDSRLRLWPAYWAAAKATAAKNAMQVQTILPSYTARAVQTTKIKLGKLAKKAKDGDKVLRCGGVLRCLPYCYKQSMCCTIEAL